jgi:hypothetical protein
MSWTAAPTRVTTDDQGHVVIATLTRDRGWVYESAVGHGI